MTTLSREDEGVRYPKSFWPAVVVGGAVMAVGVRGLLVNGADTNPRRWLVLFLASALAHDFVVAPVVIGVGVALAKALPAWVRPFAQAALLASGALALFAYPFVRGYGRRPANPSALPLDYARGLLVALGAVWLVAAALALLRRRRPVGRRSAPGQAR